MFNLLELHNDMINVHCDNIIKKEDKLLGVHKTTWRGKVEETKIYYDTRLKICGKVCLSERVLNILRENNIKTVGRLLEYTDIELLRLPLFGIKSLKEVLEALKSYSLTIKRTSSLMRIKRIYWDLED